jgi:acyl CoA:acetate/3-ketoacid CoA transferase alpha subunit
LAERGTTDHTVVSNEGGTDYFGLGMLIKNGQIKKMYSSYIGGNNELVR